MMNLRFGLIILLSVLSKSPLTAQSNKAQGTRADKQSVFLFDVNGLKIALLTNIAKVSNSYKEDEVVSCDTIDFAKDKYKGFNSLDIEGVITLKLKIPFIVNSKLLQSDEEKFTVLSQICEDEILDILFVSRKKARQLTGDSIKNSSGCILIEGNFEGRCNR